MQIQNGKIYIARGEETTFRAKLYMNDGTPFRILKQSTPYEKEVFIFTLKRTPYKRDSADDSDIILRYNMTAYDRRNPKNEHLPLLENMRVVALSNSPTPSSTGEYIPASADAEKVTTNCLYSFTGSDGVVTYYYRLAPGTKALALGKYVCDVVFVIPTDDTKNLTEDTYYYALDWESIVGMTGGYKSRKKVPLILPSEFIIGGSIYD